MDNDQLEHGDGSEGGGCIVLIIIAIIIFISLL